MSAINYTVLARQHGGVPLLDYETLARKFGGIPVNSKPVHHASNDIEELRQSAETQAPKVGDAVKAATEGVPGAKVEAVRDSKDTERIADKAERQNVQPSQIGDVLAAKVTAPDQPAAEQVLAHLHQELPVEKVEGSVNGEPQNNGVRQAQAIVSTNAPSGEPVKKAEVLIQTPEMHAATDATHDDYRKAQELRTQGKETEAKELEAGIAKEHGAAEQAARARQEGLNVSKPSSGSVLQRPQEETGEAGRGRGRVEPGQQGQDTPAQSAKAAGEQEPVKGAPLPSSARPSARRQPGQAPIPPTSLTDAATQLQQKLSTSAVPKTTTLKAPVPPSQRENLKGQSVEIRDAQSGEWKEGKVLADVVSGGNNGVRRLRGRFADGTEFDNVKPEEVRKTAAVSKTPDVAVDFDGTLAKETGSDKLGEPLPERIKSIKAMLDEGKSVVIFTRRVENDPSGKTAQKIQDWLVANGLPRLPVSDVKEAKEFYDNAAYHQPTDANTPLRKSNNTKRA